MTLQGLPIFALANIFIALHDIPLPSPTHNLPKREICLFPSPMSLHLTMHRFLFFKPADILGSVLKYRYKCNLRCIEEFPFSGENV